MFLSAIFPNSTLNQANNLQNSNRQQRTDFQQLTQALQAGNLTNAQQAFGALAKGTTSSGMESVQLSQDLNRMGAALRSGDLAGARDAYSTLLQGLQNSGLMAAHHHRPHRGGSEPPILTSGFPGETGSSNTIAGSPSEVFQPVNLTA